jgi:small subunit ribosomal protein S10
MTEKKKAAPKKAAAKKTTVKKAAPKKAAAKKTTAKSPAKKAPLSAAKAKDMSLKEVAATGSMNRGADAKGEKETKKSLSSAKQKIRVIIRAFDHKIADESANIILETAERTGALVAGPIPMPTKIEKITVNRSTFINKKAREQFEIRTHKRLIDILDANSTTIGSLSNLNLPSGCDVEIKMVG